MLPTDMNEEFTKAKNAMKLEIIGKYYDLIDDVHSSIKNSQLKIKI